MPKTAYSTLPGRQTVNRLRSSSSPISIRYWTIFLRTLRHRLFWIGCYSNMTMRATLKTPNSRSCFSHSTRRLPLPLRHPITTRSCPPSRQMGPGSHLLASAVQTLTAMKIGTLRLDIENPSTVRNCRALDQTEILAGGMADLFAERRASALS